MLNKKENLISVLCGLLGFVLISVGYFLNENILLNVGKALFLIGIIFYARAKNRKWWYYLLILPLWVFLFFIYKS